MPEGSEEIVRRLYEAMDAGDLQAARELIHPEAEWIPDRRVGEGPVRGRESIFRFFSDRAEMFSGMRTEIERHWVADDGVLVFLRVRGHGGASGAGFDVRIGHLWKVLDGVVVRGEGYGDRGEARDAARLQGRRRRGDPRRTPAQM